MAERKRFNGAGAVDYLGIGRRLLLQLRHDMLLNNLMVLSRAVQLEDGVRIVVSSVFGQDDIHVDTSDAPPLVQEALEEEVAQLPEMPRYGALQDSITISGSIRMTKTVYVPPVDPLFPLPPARPPTSNADIKTGVVDGVRFLGSIRITLTTRTYTPPSNTVTAGNTPTVFIGGGTSGGDAFVWDDVNGYQRLNKNDTFFGAKRYANVFGLSADGQTALGSIEIYDSNVNPATINPFTGAGGQAYGWIACASKWTSRTGDPQLAKYQSGAGASEARTISSGVVRGTWAGSGMTWDGSNNHAMTPSATVPARMGLTSPDGTTTVSGSTYKVSGTSRTWRGLGGSSAPNDAVPFCVVHVPPTTTTTTTPGSWSTVTSTLVFSA